MRPYDAPRAAWCPGTMPGRAGRGRLGDTRGQDPPTIMANHALVRRSRKRPRAGLLLSGVSVPLCLLLAAPAGAAVLEADQTHTVTVGDTAEAWYADSPVDVCTTPLGCPPDD